MARRESWQVDQFPSCLQFEGSYLAKGGFDAESVIKLHKEFEEIFSAKDAPPGSMNYRRIERAAIVGWLLEDFGSAVRPWWLRFAADRYCWLSMCRPVPDGRLTPPPEKLWGGLSRRRKRRRPGNGSSPPGTAPRSSAETELA